jgi:polyisoprenyl-phosphate glycosyltransferase
MGTSMDMDVQRHTVSIVVPCHNEAPCLPLLVDRVSHQLELIDDLDYELIIVDDGSSDNTFEVVQQLAASHERLSFIRFIRNFGKEAALLAGIRSAGGDAVVMIDADLEHPPEVIPEMIAKWRSGYDIVETVRSSRPTISRSLTGRMFYFLLNLISEVPIKDGIADFRLLSRRTVEAFLALPEETRFLRGQLAWFGFPTTTLHFEPGKRSAGRSTYSIPRLFGLALDAMVTLTSRPLQFALYVASFTLLVAVAYGIFVLVAYEQGLVLVSGWTSTILLILFLGSANLFCTGILGLYLRAVLAEIRQRPSYLVSDFRPGWLAGRRTAAESVEKQFEPK